MRRGQTKPLTDEQAKRYLDRLIVKNTKPKREEESFSKLSTEHKLLFAKVETLAEKVYDSNQLGHLIKPDEMLSLTQEIKTAFLSQINNIKAKIELKENVDEELKLLYFFSLCADTLVGNLLITNQFRETLLFANILRKRYLELKEITDQAIKEELITDNYVKNRPFVRLVDLNGCIARSHMELGQSQESLKCIDVALDTIESYNVNTENTPKAKNYLYRMAAIQFWKLNNADKTWNCFDYILNNNPEWHKDNDLAKCFSEFAIALLGTNPDQVIHLLGIFVGKTPEWYKNINILNIANRLGDYLSILANHRLNAATIHVTKINTKIPDWYRSEKIVNGIGECIRALLATKDIDNYSIAKDFCVLLRNFNRQTKFVNQCLDIIDKRAMRVANQKAREADKVSKSLITAATNVLPVAMDTVVPSKPKLIRENEDLEDKGNEVASTSPRNKQKTKGNVATEDKHETIPDQPISDAEKYGFSIAYADETIYPLRSMFDDREVTYYAIYPKDNITAYPDLWQTHKKIKSILEEGKIGASGNRVRYIPKKEDAFKVGNKHSNDRFFSRVAEEVVVNGNRRVLLLFTQKHNHNTQHKEYEIKTPKTRRAK